MIPRFLALWVADILANLVGYCLNPIFALWPKDLPRHLRWFQTHDADLNGVGFGGGIEPRFVRQTRWLRNGEVPKNPLCAYLCRVVWLYRNNAYGFAYSVLGAVGPFVLLSWFGDRGVTNRSPAVAGLCYEKWDGDKPYFHFWWVKPWGFGKCWEASIGWKISPGNPRAQFVCRVWPFRSFEK